MDDRAKSGDQDVIAALYITDFHTCFGVVTTEVIVGCPRDGTKTFLILEVTIIEIDGLNAERKHDSNTGLNLLRFT